MQKRVNIQVYLLINNFKIEENQGGYIQPILKVTKIGNLMLTIFICIS